MINLTNFLGMGCPSCQVKLILLIGHNSSSYLYGILGAAGCSGSRVMTAAPGYLFLVFCDIRFSQTCHLFNSHITDVPIRDAHPTDVANGACPFLPVWCSRISPTRDLFQPAFTLCKHRQGQTRSYSGVPVVFLTPHAW